MISKKSSSKSSTVRSLSSKYVSSPLPKPKSEEVISLEKKAEKRITKILNKKHRKQEINDKDCTNMQDPVSLDRIPKKYAIYIDKQCYDARILHEAVKTSFKLPHNRRYITYDELYKIEDKANGIKKLRGHTAEIKSVAFSPDGTKIVSGSRDRTVKIWNVRTGTVIHTLQGHTAKVISVDWSPDGTKIASGGSEDRTIQIWNADTGEIYKTLQIVRNSNKSGTVNEIAFSPDGTKLSSCIADGTVKIWDITSGISIKTLRDNRKNHNILSAAWSPDGTKIVCGSNQNGSIQIRDVMSGAALKTFQDQKGPVVSIAWSPDGSKIVSAHAFNKIHIWDANTGENLTILDNGTDSLRSVAWSPDGTKIASGGDDRTIRIWNANTGEVLKILTINENNIRRIFSTIWSPNGTKIASGSEDENVRIWDVSDLAQIGGKRRRR